MALSPQLRYGKDPYNLLQLRYGKDLYKFLLQLRYGKDPYKFSNLSNSATSEPQYCQALSRLNTWLMAERPGVIVRLLVRACRSQRGPMPGLRSA